MTILDPTSRRFFEQKYRTSADPWRFATDSYEQRRYGLIMEYVEVGRYQRAFEPGCSVGVLTEQLSRRCGHVLATDIAAPAVMMARDRCRAQPNVTIEQGSLAHDLPAGSFDLIVFSEVGYYFDERELGRIARQLRRILEPGGSLIAAHWTGDSNDHILRGPRVHAVLDAHLDLGHLVHKEYDDVDGTRADGFVLDTWAAAPGFDQVAS